MSEALIVVSKGRGLGVAGSNSLHNHGDDSVAKRNNAGHVGVPNYSFEN